jgi:hypothetical protein
MRLGRYSFAAFFAASLALTSGCELDGPSGDDEDADSEPGTGQSDAGVVVGEPCTPRECGPQPGAPNYQCADGSWAGPGDCERSPRTGKCAYTWRECPDDGPADAGGAIDAGPAPDAGPVPDGSVVARCGTRGGVQCGGGQFCNFEPDPACGATDKGGICEARPQVCTTIYKPVCGCDNRSYSSDCQAHGSGVSVQHQGLCDVDECKAAGGKPKYSTGADIPSCAAGEEQWNLAGGIEPVICCVPKPKPEPGGGKMCGGFAGLSCDGDSFCNYELEAGGQGCEGIADGSGVCEPVPQVCTFEYAPVCGCDYRSYPTRCAAHAEGMSVLREGACTEIDCAKIGGKPVDGLGPAPVCPPGQTDHGFIEYSNGQIAIEGTICCVP